MHPKDIVAACVRARMPAVAVTDRNNLFGAMEFADVACAAGVQPITGCALTVKRSDTIAAYDTLVLLAQSPTGYTHLSALVSAAHMDVEAGAPPHVTRAQLHGSTEGVMALTGGYEGALYRLLADEQADAAREYLSELQTLFGDRLYVELNRIGHAEEVRVEEAMIALAYALDIPLVATNPILFEAPENYAAHDILLCIQQGRVESDPERQTLNRQLWFKSPKEMARLFADVPEAIANTAIIAQRCAAKAPARKPILPHFSDDTSEDILLRQLSAQGLDDRLRDGPVAMDQHAAYKARLDFELDVIIRMGFAGYFLIVADFIGWAKRQSIPVGPGRGSGAGSVVAWSLNITDLDPIRFGLLFERFLNPDRVSMPDFDIDFCETRRSDVIHYVQQKYGRRSVAQIITFGKLKARAVVKDVGRALHMPYGQVDALSKLIPNNPAQPMSLAEALSHVPELRQRRDADPDVARLLMIAQQLEGLYRHASTHAAGVVIGDRPLDQLVPLYRDPRSDMPVTQFDMKWVEKAGLVKFDFLGLKTLSILQTAVKFLEDRQIKLDLLKIPLDDARTFELMAQGDTLGVFQLESEGMRRTLALVRPDTFEDIIALVSLYRPGPMENIPAFANRKNGREKPDYLHPLLEPLLKETYGIIIYQEQVMQIAQVLSGYSLGQADLLRRAMGKKKKEEMDMQRAVFAAGASRAGVDEATATYIFDLVEKFAGYGFNKSHAAAYALIAYQTAYIKANYPVEFFAASLTYEMSNTDKIATFIDDMKRANIAMLPPDINHSQAYFAVEKQGDSYAVRYALAALKGVGEKAMEALVEERCQHGAFRSFGDLAARLDVKSINRRQLESLAHAGAFDGLVKTRSQAASMVDLVLTHATAATQSRGSTQSDMFGTESGAQRIELLVKNQDPWPAARHMAAEKDSIGFYLSAHPLDGYAEILQSQDIVSITSVAQHAASGRRSFRIAGLIDDVRLRPSKSGGQFALVQISDASGSAQVGCFDADVVTSARSFSAKQEPVVIRIELVWREGEETPRMNAREIVPLSTLAAAQTRILNVFVEQEKALPFLVTFFQSCPPGHTRIHLHLTLAQGATVAEMCMPGSYRFDLSRKHDLLAQEGITHVSCA